MSTNYMKRAIELARQARGLTSPNPPVGAVLVRDGKIVGEGLTRPAGQEHAEAVALEAAGNQAEGSTLYVTLEPCSHWGRTAPCADALIAAGISRANIALIDPNPLINGKGASRLREAGVDVMVGEEAEEAAGVVEAHLKYITQRKPFVTQAVDLPKDQVSELYGETDILLVRHDGVPSGSKPVYRFSREPGGLRIRRVGGSDHLGIMRLPEEVEAASYQGLLSQLGRYYVTAALVLGGEKCLEDLGGDALADKVVRAAD